MKETKPGQNQNLQMLVWCGGDDFNTHFTRLKSIMNKQGLVDMVNEKIGGPKTQAEEVVNAIFDTITSTLKAGDEVSIAGFGSFIAQQRAARTARNPRTGEAVQVAAKRVPKFKAAKAFKDAIA